MVVMSNTRQSEISLHTDLTYNQENRYAALQRNEAYSKVCDVLLGKTHGQFLVYGGMAMMVEKDDVLPILDSSTTITSDMVTVGGTLDEKLDSPRNSDIDLMVDEIGEVDQLIGLLREKLGEKYKVLASNLTDYPRIDVVQNGVEVMSISDLKTSVGTVKKINEALGVENIGSDLEIYMKAKLLKNDMDPILVSNDGAGLIMFSGREGATDLIEINEQSIYRPEVADVLSEQGNRELAQVVMREWAYNVGKVAVMTQFGMRMEPSQQEVWRQEVVDNSDWVKMNSDIMRNFSRRIVKAINGNFGWFKMAAVNFGILSWYSEELDKEMLEIYNTPVRWQQMTDQANEMDKKMGEGVPHSIDDFVALVLDGVGGSRRTEIEVEFRKNWNPGDMSGVAFATGKKIKTV
ncbi:hypothetical protein KBC75_01245 [Candidatus Shapirobacteria bacterium]|nr:hypothetical protein [Candidatus Shapirobacteria bacterium]